MKNLWAKRWFKILSVVLALFLILIICFNSILRGVGRWLSASDTPELTSMCFVLGGNSYERGIAAAKLYEQFPEQLFITTGGNYPYQILCLDTSMLECELTRSMMVHKGVPLSKIDTLGSAHSTMDESNEILKWCHLNQVNNITIISSAFHLRRARMVFEDKFSEAGITVHFLGAAPIEYNELNWWNNEEGLIMTNNELVKLLYYLVKY